MFARSVRSSWISWADPTCPLDDLSDGQVLFDQLCACSYLIAYLGICIENVAGAAPNLQILQPNPAICMCPEIAVPSQQIWSFNIQGNQKETAIWDTGPTQLHQFSRFTCAYCLPSCPTAEFRNAPSPSRPLPSPPEQTCLKASFWRWKTGSPQITLVRLITRKFAYCIYTLYWRSSRNTARRRNCSLPADSRVES